MSDTPYIDSAYKAVERELDAKIEQLTHNGCEEKRRAPHHFPFVITVDSIAGGTVEKACHEAIGLSRHLRCMVCTNINDIQITVSGAIMTGEDAYEHWKHQSLKSNI